MKFIYGKNDWSSITKGQENCFLLTNGLGGFSSLSIIGSNTRSDHSLLMASLKAPNKRYNLISNIGEILKTNNTTYDLTSQEYLDEKSNRNGFFYESKFTFEDIPTWTYDVNGIEINKCISMKYRQNTVAIKYTITNFTNNDTEYVVTPYLQFVKKGTILDKNQQFNVTYNYIKSSNIILNYKTNGIVNIYNTKYIDNILYSHDERDGREKHGCCAYNHDIHFKISSKSKNEFYIIYSMNKIASTVDEIITDYINYKNDLVNKCNLKNPIAQMLIKSANDFIVDRDSTKGKTIIAGYPFFEDWGRDTMISFYGCTLVTNQFKSAKSILKTFIQYVRRGIVPNLFPEGKDNAMYNTCDAALLFINSIYDYYKISHDIEFIKEAYNIMDEIIYWYRRGTDFNIKMDTDGLICAGQGLDQVTWMDVRINNILPTPRHGKPVEVNAYWYNALRIMDVLSKELGYDEKDYFKLSELVKKNFILKFWNEDKSCLKDVISGTKADNQIRCNQIYAVSMNFSILDKEKEKKVVNTVFEKLYTPYGLRTLSKDDPDFKGFYGGSQLNRDLAYHQGTIWTFPLGGYYLAFLKVNDYSKSSINLVKSQLETIEPALREGCIGQLPEIYDGNNPTISKGCFAQAWSVGEILKVYKVINMIENNN